MSIGVVDIFDKVVSHAQSLGIFDTVNTHEPKSAPGNGLHCFVVMDRLAPARGNSGLQATTGLLTLLVRVQTQMLSEPQDDIDPGILIACDTLLEAYSGDFTLGDSVRCVDLLGMSGTAMSLTAGYIDIGNTKYRVMEIVLPLIVDQVWSQVP
jgi:hypothetical protein